MSDWYLKVEGVNLGNFVNDTENLSTIRGGGLLLLHAISRLVDKFESQMQPVTTGASAGLFQILSDDTSQTIKDQVIQYLHQDPVFKHATFVVDVHHAAGENYPRLREAILAKNRWQQMQAPNLAIPSPFSGTQPCQIDEKRPAASRYGPNGVSISESVYQRWCYGKEQKQAFYKLETGIPDLPEFVTDLDSLTAGPRSVANLNHKMAVIYIDGNDFGKIQRKYCEADTLQDGISKQQRFDHQIKSLRRNLLKDLITDLTAPTASAAWQNDSNIRFETLLWGGDEIIWVVPAWCGFWTIGRFFQLACGWKLDDGIELTHGAGIVFCNHKAPIHRMTELARNLAELAKQIDRTRNLVAYEVLESFDNAGNNLEASREKLRPRIIQQDQMLLPGERLTDILPAQPVLREMLSRRGLYSLVRKIYHTVDPADTQLSREADDLVKEAGSDAQAAVRAMEPCFGTSPAFWIHLITLWDYIIDPKKVQP